jgi:hypothetical protein
VRVDEELILGKGARECPIPLRNRGIRQDAVISGDDVRRVFYLLNISALLQRSEALGVEFGVVNNAPISASYVNEIKLLSFKSPLIIPTVELKVAIMGYPARLDWTKILSSDIAIRKLVCKFDGPDTRTSTQVKGLGDICGHRRKMELATQRFQK